MAAVAGHPGELVAFWYAAREVDPRELFCGFGQGRLPLVSCWLWRPALGQVARTWRWRLLFHRATRPPWRETFAALSVGYLVSTVIPLRLGDPIRAWAVGRYTRRASPKPWPRSWWSGCSTCRL